MESCHCDGWQWSPSWSAHSTTRVMCESKHGLHQHTCAGIYWFKICCLLCRWSYGITLWEICTLGGHPYPSIGNKQLLQHILQGNRLEKPHNCSDDVWVQTVCVRSSISYLTKWCVNCQMHFYRSLYTIKMAVDSTYVPHYTLSKLLRSSQPIFSCDWYSTGSAFQIGRISLPLMHVWITARNSWGA